MLGGVMQKFTVFQVVMALCVVLVLPVNAQASGFSRSMGVLGKNFIWGVPEHPGVKPYLEDAKLPHNSRWADDEWEPQDWIESRGGNPMNVINGFYDAGIITDQYFDDDIPVLEVGQTFIELGAKDKRRVVAFIDDVFGVTQNTKAGVIVIYLDHKGGDVPIGEFNKNGLQLQ